MAEQADLSDLPTLMSHLLAGASRGGDPATSRLLEAAAAALQREVAEAKVQRGMAVASQTLAAELSLKVEQLQARLIAAEDGVPADNAPRANTTAYSHSAATLYERGGPWAPSPSAAPVEARSAAAGRDDGPPRAFKTWVEAPSTQGSAAGSSAPPAAPAAAAEAEVDVMVQNLKQRFRQSGVALPLEKHSGCVYRLGAKKLSLNLRNSRLMVRVGGGYADFLEYLSKASI